MYNSPRLQMILVSLHQHLLCTGQVSSWTESLCRVTVLPPQHWDSQKWGLLGRQSCRNQHKHTCAFVELLCTHTPGWNSAGSCLGRFVSFQDTLAGSSQHPPARQSQHHKPFSSCRASSAGSHLISSNESTQKCVRLELGLWVCGARKVWFICREGLSAPITASSRVTCIPSFFPTQQIQPSLQNLVCLPPAFLYVQEPIPGEKGQLRRCRSQGHQARPWSSAGEQPNTRPQRLPSEPNPTISTLWAACRPKASLAATRAAEARRQP